jgi:hypothetical protein
MHDKTTCNPQINRMSEPGANFGPAPRKSQSVGRALRQRVAGRLLGAALIAATGSLQAQIPWYTGQRAYGQVTVEPAIDSATGNEIFLHTPDNAPLPSNAAQRAHAPLYLVLYPTASSIDANTLNCQPTNCDHVQTFAYPLKGHDHLVGVPHTGDFNVAWDVILVAFTPQGFEDGAIDTRILTLDQLTEAADDGDVALIGPVTSFNCSITSVANYLKGTPLSFPTP